MASVYLTHDEAVRELANRTVHALMHLGWVKHPDGYHLQMAVLVKPNGWFGEGLHGADQTVPLPRGYPLPYLVVGTRDAGTPRAVDRRTQTIGVADDGPNPGLTPHAPPQAGNNQINTPYRGQAPKRSRPALRAGTELRPQWASPTPEWAWARCVLHTAQKGRGRPRPADHSFRRMSGRLCTPCAVKGRGGPSRDGPASTWGASARWVCPWVVNMASGSGYAAHVARGLKLAQRRPGGGVRW